ncbi:MarR family transcriptional regulator [Actinoplanes sp. NPDC049596]|uniref:MarR family winged helix-turn-helix transcriptional regulator n=1 Tax=unclassified Actinoplanes TaxID=2626549 RepID=UPI00342C670E
MVDALPQRKLHAVEANLPAAASSLPAESITLAAVFSHLVRSETRLYNGLNDVLRREHGLVASQFEFLRYLRDHPRSRVADLAEFYAIGIGATSKSAGRLEDRGWVRRVPNPADGRSLLLELTPAGAELTEAAEITFQRYLVLRMGRSIDPEQLEAVGRTLGRLREDLERDGVGIPVG